MRPQRIGSSNCLAKTQVYAKPKGGAYGLTLLPSAGNEEERLAQTKLKLSAQSGGRNYNGPKDSEIPWPVSSDPHEKA